MDEFHDVHVSAHPRHVQVFSKGGIAAAKAPPRETVWIVGVVFLMFMISTAFMSTVQPWGQVRFGGATVVISLASAIPAVGCGVSSNTIEGCFSC